jgi:hypothetical protein
VRFFLGRPRFFGGGGVFKSARTASSKLPVIGGIVVVERLRFATGLLEAFQLSHYQGEPVLHVLKRVCV